jgi:hypothetical protein
MDSAVVPVAARAFGGILRGLCSGPFQMGSDATHPFLATKLRAGPEGVCGDHSTNLLDFSIVAIALAPLASV